MVRTEYPFPMFVYPTLRCNFSCSYCFTWSGPSESPRSFILDHWNELITACGAVRVPEIRISGGEPLLIDDIEQRCRFIVERGIRYTLLTNGSLLGRHLGWLSAQPPATLWISYHREFASVAGFARQVTRAADSLPSVGVHVFSCDVETNAELVDRAILAGAKRIKILSLTPIGRCNESGKTGTWPRNLIEEMTARWKGLKNEKFEVRVEAPVFGDFATGENTCVLRERPLLSIDHDGSVYPCCVTLGSRATAIGSLQDNALETIVRQAKSPSSLLPCHELLPSIGIERASCPLRLVTLS